MKAKYQLMKIQIKQHLKHLEQEKFSKDQRTPVFVWPQFSTLALTFALDHMNCIVPARTWFVRQVVQGTLTVMAPLFLP